MVWTVHWHVHAIQGSWKCVWTSPVPLLLSVLQYAIERDTPEPSTNRTAAREVCLQPFCGAGVPTGGSTNGFGPLPSLAPWDNTDNNNPNSNNSNRGRSRSSRIFFFIVCGEEYENVMCSCFERGRVGGTTLLL